MKSGQIFLCNKAINVIKHNMAKQTTVEYVKTNSIIKRNQKETILTLLIFEFYRNGLSSLVSTSIYDEVNDKEYDFFNLYKLMCIESNIYISGGACGDRYFKDNCFKLMK